MSCACPLANVTVRNPPPSSSSCAAESCSPSCGTRSRSASHTVSRRSCGSFAADLRERTERQPEREEREEKDRKWQGTFGQE